MSTWTQADVDTLKAAIASGVLQVRYDGPPARSVTYQSLREMRDLLAAMLADLAASSTSRPRYTLARTRKGL
jgi:hypothetical protein